MHPLVILTAGLLAVVAILKRGKPRPIARALPYIEEESPDDTDESPLDDTVEEPSPVDPKPPTVIVEVTAPIPEAFTAPPPVDVEPST